ncbi:NAD(P)H-hydrate dehydratase [Candidatus Aerophobetes bacterium]|uniref:Bifunctional NAD(P)H-hydrate repair enzyme n=1 Tax=Aerophobetes bacterium TaxID=2030807 RepID=A0A523Y4B1_UNCAE|nr:MAG: NAD(P)H-hydrate dehydratase [Candidatus Aerophobetes bacterium]
MKLVTSEEMRRIDKKAIEEIGIPSIVLMENAGLKVADAIERKYGPLKEKYVYIFAGSGNNGGDGMVVARHLFNQKVKAKIFLLAEKKNIKGDAATNLAITEKMGIPMREITSPAFMESLEKELAKADIVVDALLGTGAKGAPRGLMKKVIDLINKHSKNTVAVDIPTGVDADRGEVRGEAIKAEYTVSLAYPKRGLYLYPGMDYAGEIEIADIGIPTGLEGDKINCELLTLAGISKKLFFRKPSSHKGSFGHLLVIAGSPGMTGAASLTALSALRVGAGLVTLGIPEDLNPILETKLTEVMTLPLPQSKDKTLCKEGFEKIKDFSQKCKAMAIGPGISSTKQTKELISTIIDQLDIPLVIDADGINVLAGELSLLKKYKASLIITPHPGEMSRLVGASVEEIQKDRIGFTMALARRIGAIVVLKGARTVIASKEGNSWVNLTGNPGMATGGSGDILTGIIGGLLTQKLSCLEAAKTGVYLHGYAADLAAQKKGEISLIASDTLETIPEATRRIKSEYS